MSFLTGLWSLTALGWVTLLYWAWREWREIHWPYAVLTLVHVMVAWNCP